MPAEVRILGVRMSAGKPMVNMGQFDSPGPGDPSKQYEVPVPSHSAADIKIMMEQWAAELGKQEDDAKPIPMPVIAPIPVPRKP